MRYEGHRLYVRHPNEDEEDFVFGGFLGAAILAAYLVDTEEGNARAIALATDEELDAFFAQYEREVLHDDWGHLIAEATQLNDAYIQLDLTQTDLEEIIPNLRLLDLIMGLVVQYMERLIRETFGEHIWEYKPWTDPFAQWLYDAAFAETKRQRFLKTQWTDVLMVNSLVEGQAEEKPTLFFEGEDASDIMARYFDWFSTGYKAMRREEPGATVTAQDLRHILHHETDYTFLEPDLADLDPDSLRSFRRWMDEWKTFITAHLPIDDPKPIIQDSRQELFLDSVLPVPKENSYSAVREYIRERSKYDKEFKKFVNTRKRTLLCHQLTLMFGWCVDPNSLGKSMKRKLRYPRKDLLK